MSKYTFKVKHYYTLPECAVTDDITVEATGEEEARKIVKGRYPHVVSIENIGAGESVSISPISFVDDSITNGFKAGELIVLSGTIKVPKANLEIDVEVFDSDRAKFDENDEYFTDTYGDKYCYCEVSDWRTRFNVDNGIIKVYFIDSTIKPTIVNYTFKEFTVNYWKVCCVEQPTDDIKNNILSVAFVINSFCYNRDNVLKVYTDDGVYYNGVSKIKDNTITFDDMVAVMGEYWYNNSYIKVAEQLSKENKATSVRYKLLSEESMPSEYKSIDTDGLNDPEEGEEYIGTTNNNDYYYDTNEKIDNNDVFYSGTDAFKLSEVSDWFLVTPVINETHRLHVNFKDGKFVFINDTFKKFTVTMWKFLCKSRGITLDSISIEYDGLKNALAVKNIDFNQIVSFNMSSKELVAINTDNKTPIIKVTAKFNTIASILGCYWSDDSYKDQTVKLPEATPLKCESIEEEQEIKLPEAIPLKFKYKLGVGVVSIILKDYSGNEHVVNLKDIIGWFITNEDDVVNIHTKNTIYFTYDYTLQKFTQLMNDFYQRQENDINEEI